VNVNRDGDENGSEEGKVSEWQGIRVADYQGGRVSM
jgi:hypothetical protein